MPRELHYSLHIVICDLTDLADCYVRKKNVLEIICYYLYEIAHFYIM